MLYSSINYTGLAFPGPSAYPFYSASQSNTCNVYIPNDATLSRCAMQKHPRDTTSTQLLSCSKPEVSIKHPLTACHA